MNVTVYTKPACVQCNATYLKALGYMQAPVVVTDQDHWSGFRPDKIEELAQSAAVAVA
jgi:glutaredoxin-like protein NrdH